MTDKNNGGPAFPVVAENGLGHVSDGMSMRDWFAGQAIGHVIDAAEIRPWAPELYATMAYRVADAMLAERNK